MAKASNNRFPQIVLAEQATPPTPATALSAGEWELYMDTDDKLYKVDHTGAATEIGGVSAVVATGAELDTGTDNAKFASAKALKDSHNVPSVAPGTSGNVLTSNGTDWTSAAPTGGSSYYEPDTPPASAGTYDDEFNDDSLSVDWTAPANDENFNMLQTNGAVHVSESIMHGYLMLQGSLGGEGNYAFYKAFTPATNQAFTVVCKVHNGTYQAANDMFFGFAIRGNADNVFYELRVGRNFASELFRTVYANGGGAAQGATTGLGYSPTSYLMITCDGSKNFSAFVSGDGRGWSCVELSRSLSNLSSFSRLGFFITSSTVNGISAIDYVRYFTTAGQYKIGLDV